MKKKMEFTISTIGHVKIHNGLHSIAILDKYKPGLMHLDGFSHLHILWWAHLNDNPEARNRLTASNLFKLAPPESGVFATRSPERPNPIMISVVKVEQIDHEKGIISIPFIDAENMTPVLDIKPYFPVERIRSCHTAPYYNHWPKWAEDAERFNWKDEISLENI